MPLSGSLMPMSEPCHGSVGIPTSVANREGMGRQRIGAHWGKRSIAGVSVSWLSPLPSGFMVYRSR